MIRLGELILERGLVEKAALIEALEDVSHVPYLDCTTVECDPNALLLIPVALAYRLNALPIAIEGLNLVVVMAEPQNIAIIDELRFSTGKDISPRFAFRAEILAAIQRNYGHSDAYSGAGPLSSVTGTDSRQLRERCSPN